MIRTKTKLFNIAKLAVHESLAARVQMKLHHTWKLAVSSPRLKAQLAGVCYLITIGVGASDHLFMGLRLTVTGGRLSDCSQHHSIPCSPRLSQLRRQLHPAQVIPQLG
jgi:hypothetical protein